MNYVKWKHRAQKSRQYVIMGSIFMICSLVGVLFFVLLLTGVIPAEKTGGSKISIVSEKFGITKDNKVVERFTLMNTKPGGIQVQIITLGGAISSVKVPDISGHVDDVILGFDHLAGYQRTDNPQFGAVLGRFAGIIDQGRFTLNGRMHQMSLNAGQHGVNGGGSGWDQAIWNGTIGEGEVTLFHRSPDGDEHFPGEILAQVTFKLTEDNEIIITHEAESRGKPSPVNMAIQPYINLAGEGSMNVYEHEVTLYADKYLPMTSEHIPTGDIAIVNGTVFDLTRPTGLATRISPVATGDVYKGEGGYHHTYCIKGTSGKRHAATVYDPTSGRVLDVYTNQPGIELYTANSVDLAGGKAGHHYGKHSALCLTSLNYPDAINQPNFPDCVLHPGSSYIHTTWYKFSTK